MAVGVQPRPLPVDGHLSAGHRGIRLAEWGRQGDALVKSNSSRTDGFAGKIGLHRLLLRTAAASPRPLTSWHPQPKPKAVSISFLLSSFRSPHLEDDLEEVGGVVPGLAPREALVQDDAQRVHIHLLQVNGINTVGGATYDDAQRIHIHLSLQASGINTIGGAKWYELQC